MGLWDSTGGAIVVLRWRLSFFGLRARGWSVPPVPQWPKMPSCQLLQMRFAQVGALLYGWSSVLQGG